MTEPIIKKAFADYAQVLRFLDDSVELLERMAGVLIESLRAGGKVLVFGNGGSAADAQHIAAELLGRFNVGFYECIPNKASSICFTDGGTCMGLGVYS